MSNDNQKVQCLSIVWERDLKAAQRTWRSEVGKFGAGRIVHAANLPKTVVCSEKPVT